jgi:thiol-disulfide isomerase/thioredoxin
MPANTQKEHKKKNKSNKKGLYVILIHANGCGYCEQLMPEWEKMEGMVKGDNTLNGKCDVVKIERANMENEMINNREIPVAGYPTIVSIKDGNLHNYNGDRTADELLNWIKQLANRKQQERQIYLGGKKSRRKRRKHSGCKSCKSGRILSFKFW